MHLIKELTINVLTTNKHLFFRYDLAFSAVAEAKSMAKGETHEMKPTTSKVTPKTDVETVSDVVPREIKGQIPVVKQAQMSKKLRQAAITCIKEAFGK